MSKTWRTLITILAAAAATLTMAQPATAAPADNPAPPRGDVVAATPIEAPSIDPNAPLYHFKDGDNRTTGDEVGVMADLPFSYEFEFENSMYGRNFYQTGKVCNDISVYSYRTIYVSLWRNVWGPDQKVGPTVSYPRGWHTWCWDGGQGAFTYYFYFQNGYALGEGYAHNP